MKLLLQNRVAAGKNRRGVKRFNNQLFASLLFLVVVISGFSLCCPEIALADFNLDNFGKSIADPAKKAFNDFYPVGVLVAGGVGAFLHGQGDFRDRMLSFGKGAAIGGMIVAGVKAGFGI